MIERQHTQIVMVTAHLPRKHLTRYSPKLNFIFRLSVLLFSFTWFPQKTLWLSRLYSRLLFNLLYTYSESHSLPICCESMPKLHFFVSSFSLWGCVSQFILDHLFLFSPCTILYFLRRTVNSLLWSRKSLPFLCC